MEPYSTLPKKMAPAESRSGVKVLDLSRTPPNRKELSPLEQRILDALRRATAGALSTDELLAVVRDHSFSDVERALRDLSLRGMVRILWRTPFRFLAFLVAEEKREARTAQRIPQLVAV